MLTLPPYEGRERIIHTHENAYRTILLWACEIFRIPLSQNKRQ